MKTLINIYAALNVALILTAVIGYIVTNLFKMNLQTLITITLIIGYAIAIYVIIESKWKQ